MTKTEIGKWEGGRRISKRERKEKEKSRKINS
jgi:hypothetical protein